jgi:molybdopterin-guanine dinucleotide biosynthesis protein A
MIADCTALILAGGESRRMGRDKANLLLGGKPLLQHVIEVVQPLFENIIVSTRHIRTDCDFPQVCDDPGHAGPLAGLNAGLAHAATPWVFALACDMPFITPELIAHLAKFRDRYDAVVPVVQGHPQPLAAFYARRIRGELRELQQGSGKQSLRELLKKLTVRYVDEAEIQAADLSGFIDLDTPEDVSVAESQMRYNSRIY